MKKLLVTLFLSLNLIVPMIHAQEATPSSSVNVIDNPQSPTKLEKYLTVEAALLGVNNRMSLYFQDLSKNIETSIDPTRSWIPASTIKSYVVLEAFRQRRQGLISFDQPVTIKGENVVTTELETDDYPLLLEGVTVTIEQLLGAMITQSDNTAYNTLLDVLDRRNINSTLGELGITETVVGEKLNLDDGQFALDLKVPGRQPNTTTVKDMARLFYLLYSGQYPNSEEILAIFKKQKINSMIPALLPEKTTVAHKTGDWAPIYHDGGIIYKSDDPFILIIFTNSNDPSVLAKLARVAYFQNADVVGQALSIPPRPIANRLQDTFYLSEVPTEANVLGLEASQNGERTISIQEGESLWTISEKFYGTGEYWSEIAHRNLLLNADALSVGLTIILPGTHPFTSTQPADTYPKVSAFDLGITNKDILTDSEDADKIKEARIPPTSFLYGIKTLWESVENKFAFTDSQKVAIHLSFAKNRLAEIKILAKQGDLVTISKLLQSSEQEVVNALLLSKTKIEGKSVPTDMMHVDQVNNLQFAILSAIAPSVPPSKKEEFVDMVYSFYNKNKKEVTSKLERTLLANPLSQPLIIGTVKETKGNVVTIEFTDGSTKGVLLTEDTPIRQFNNSSLDSSVNLSPGSKIAVVAWETKDNQIIPQFILRNIPKELPDKNVGTVIEIDTKNNQMKIRNSQGAIQIIEIGDSTVLKGKDTTVSLSGIKVGSKVTVFGEPEKNAPVSPSSIVPSNPSTDTLPKTKPANVWKPTPESNKKSIEKNQNAQNVAPQQVVKATSITVTNNDSGKKQVSSSAPAGQNKPSETKQNTNTQSHENKPAEQPKSSDAKPEQKNESKPSYTKSDSKNDVKKDGNKK